MTVEREYEFKVVRVKSALIETAGGVLTEDDLEDEWENLVDDGTESAILLSDAKVSNFANQVVSGIFSVSDPRHGAWHEDALASLSNHDDCSTVIEELIAERDDVLDGLIQARSYLFNDIYEGEYGDLYVDADTLLRLLRPTIRGASPFRALDTAPNVCDECGALYSHDGGCSIEQWTEDLQSRREHAIASHLHCAQMGNALIAHTTRCIERVETTALRVHLCIREAAGEQVVKPRHVLSGFKIEDLNVAHDSSSPESLVAGLYPTLEDLDYCGEEPFHTSPHRACRYLVS